MKIATDLYGIIREVEQYSDYHEHIDRDILLHILKHYQALVNLHADNCREEALLGIEKRKGMREKEEARVKALNAIRKCAWCGAILEGACGAYCSAKCNKENAEKGWKG